MKSSDTTRVSFLESVKNYLVIDSLSYSNTGLSGKAGVALALFELSENDAVLGDYAFEFFQESLAFVNNNFCYKGTIGIGIILNYLIDNEFIDADFGELFGDSHGQIVKQVLSKTYPEGNVCDLLLYFLLSNEITDSNEECINALLSCLRDIITCPDKDYIRKKWQFIATHYISDTGICRFIQDTGIDFKSQFSDGLNCGNGLTGRVNALFNAMSTHSETEEIIEAILQMKLNFKEPDLNLALSRLLILLSNPAGIPSKLLFFFY